MSLKPLRIAALLGAMLVAACSSTLTTPFTASSDATSRAQLEQDARDALKNLYASTPRAKELSANAAGVLVFPSILKAGLLIGGSGGNGVLFGRDGSVKGYYNAGAVSWGMQAGAQNFSEAMVLMTPEAVKNLDTADGWSVGMGPSVAVADSGMARDVTTTTARPDVFAFIYGQSGLMAGLGVQGQKITRLPN
ncbi:lipid-binding SYLF domain-containing protein [Paraburkholderia sp. J67]|uniref:lipid-binding SYLF domain-containing protein n=1 Tax=Paraburkholderia sp. J67 TaxID=2805435 RepID=UPI002ABD7DB7|nr:lipid-binding SYLF domain-containing protein [Paraburkholderia sp. J67]